MELSNRVRLSKEERQTLIASIKAYFLTERDLDLGELAASLILDFFIEELAPAFYNQGIYDAYRCLNNQIEDVLALQVYKR